MTREPNQPPFATSHGLHGLVWYRRMRITSGVAAIVLFFAVMYTVTNDPLLFGVGGLANGLVFMLYALVCAYFYITKRRFTRRIRDHNGRVCTSCGYLLTPELDHKPCPECGTPIDLDLYRTQWIQALGGWKQFPPP